MDTGSRVSSRANQSPRSKTNQLTGSRFAVLADDVDKSFPVSNAEQEQHVPIPRMSAFTKAVSQAASKSAVRKKKKEQKSLIIAPENEGVNDPEFTRRAEELRQKCWTEKVKGEGGHTVWPAPDTLSRPPNQRFAI